MVICVYCVEGSIPWPARSRRGPPPPLQALAVVALLAVASGFTITAMASSHDARDAARNRMLEEAKAGAASKPCVHARFARCTPHAP